jgi:hypothetical protein
MLLSIGQEAYSPEQGGTLRLGELTPERAPHGPKHALKLELDAFNYYYSPCYRFPANTCDGYQKHQQIRWWAAGVMLMCAAAAGCVWAVRQKRCTLCSRSISATTDAAAGGLAVEINTSETDLSANAVTIQSSGCCRTLVWLGAATWLALSVTSAVMVLFPSISASYRGDNPSLQMGSLLAVPPDASASHLGLETVPGRMLHWTLQNYGAYVVDTTGWNVYALCTEVSPQGDVVREFEEAWNFSMVPKGGKTYDKTGAHDVPSTGWGRDIERLIKSMHVVDNWDQAMYERVAKSAGRLGVGGGAARQPWAEPLPPAPK